MLISKKIIIVWIFLSSLTSYTVKARVLHVSQNQLSEIDSQVQLRSIGEAAALLQAGDTLIIHNGIYRERINIDKDGTSEKPIVISAATGEYVVVTGADRLTQWQKEDGQDNIFSTDWPYKFITWTKYHSHPDDDYHRLIGRCEQVFINGYPLRQVLKYDQLSRGTFCVDLLQRQLYIWNANNADIGSGKEMVEASVRDHIWKCRGRYIVTKGIRFKYAANRAQNGAVLINGDHNTVEDCIFEYTNASGAQFTGKNIVVRNCIFQNNGQLGFSANRAHGLFMSGCTIRNNNIKGFDRGWEAGGNKIVLTRNAIIENSIFIENKGDGIWFDIGNENNEVRNCLIAYNENAGIFYEISYGLYAHDNVIVGNGFAHSPGEWGASSGISLSSSPNCIVERNLILGNKEGFNFREQIRKTPRINGNSETVWNHDQIIRHNVLAYNRDAQLWGWFDVQDQRHWPRSMQSKPKNDLSKSTYDPVKKLTLADLRLQISGNIYWAAPGQGFINWGVPWRMYKKYKRLEDVQSELSLTRSDKREEVLVKSYFSLDLRVPTECVVLHNNCYPRGKVPGVTLGTYE